MLPPLSLLLGAALLAPAPEAPPRPTVGAIRWDAWSGGAVTAQVEQTLGPRPFHPRLPWFAEVSGFGASAPSRRGRIPPG